MSCLQEGTSEDEALYGIDITDDGSVILGGATYGAWVGTNAGESDFVAVKLSATETEEWRWKVRRRRLWVLSYATLQLTKILRFKFGCGRCHDLLTGECTSPYCSQYIWVHGDHSEYFRSYLVQLIGGRCR